MNILVYRVAIGKKIKELHIHADKWEEQIMWKEDRHDERGKIAYKNLTKRTFFFLKLDI